ncbi:hypothetical protein PAMC26577_14350 [Caballeronia sordidicola]|uniref:Uncharacterized protein n=1 Tax=Caballeronia sordidicola TaxID=196367 RepID=A0A242MTY7_CABSO|nr:hypothetical protein PAMC26577_14350 [Caballeronia sordidicola]
MSSDLIERGKARRQSIPIRISNLAMWRPSLLREARPSHAICIKH